MIGIYPNWVTPDPSSVEAYAQETIYPAWLRHHIGVVARHLLSNITVTSHTATASAFAHRNLLSHVIAGSLTTAANGSNDSTIVVGFNYTETGVQILTIQRSIYSRRCR